MNQNSHAIHDWVPAMLEQLPYGAVLFNVAGDCLGGNQLFHTLTGNPTLPTHLKTMLPSGEIMPPAFHINTPQAVPSNTGYRGHMEWRVLRTPGSDPVLGMMLCFLPETEMVNRHHQQTLAELQASQIEAFKHLQKLQEAKDETERMIEFLNTVINFLPNPVFVKDSQHRFVILNDACCYLIGQSRESLLGKSDYDFFPKEEADIFWKKDDLVLNSNEINENEEFLTDANGLQHCIITRKASFTYRNGQRALVGVILDLTEQKRLIEELIYAKEQAEEANHAKSDFLAKMSHELRTPLNSVIGFTLQLLKNKTHNLADKDILFLQRIQENGHHLLNLINEVLDLSRIESGILEVQIQSVQLPEFLQNLLAQFDVQAHEKGLQLHLEIEPGIKTIATDREKLRQILNNLLANALKFTAQGSIILNVLASPHSKQKLTIEVKDTGIGIPLEKQAVIFDAFRQEDDSIQRQYGGTGLGLTIARRLCELLGYQLEMESEPGHGSVFRVRLEPVKATH